jgi:hypothetical protein
MPSESLLRNVGHGQGYDRSPLARRVDHPLPPRRSWRGLEARAYGAQDGVDLAAQKERSGDREDGDERGDERVFGQTLAFLADAHKPDSLTSGHAYRT